MIYPRVPDGNTTVQPPLKRGIIAISSEFFKLTVSSRSMYVSFKASIKHDESGSRLNGKIQSFNVQYSIPLIYTDPYSRRKFNVMCCIYSKNATLHSSWGFYWLVARFYWLIIKLHQVCWLNLVGLILYKSDLIQLDICRLAPSC